MDYKLSIGDQFEGQQKARLSIIPKYYIDLGRRQSLETNYTSEHRFNKQSECNQSFDSTPDRRSPLKILGKSVLSTQQPETLATNLSSVACRSSI